MLSTYIQEAIGGRLSVTVYTVNGYQLKGSIIAEFEDHVLIFSNGKKRMVYKHAISTIEPA